MQEESARALYASLAARIEREGCCCTLPAFPSPDARGTADFLSSECRAANAVIISDTAKISAPQKIGIKGSGNLVIVGAGVNLANSSLGIDGNGGCIVIGDGAWLTGGNVALRFNGGFVAIGRNFAWQGGNIFCSSEGSHIVVGDDCLFAEQVTLRTADGHSIFDKTTQEKVNNPASVVVHEHV